RATGLAHAPHKLDRRRRTHRKPRRRLSGRAALLNRTDKTLPQILGQWCRHHSLLAAQPASSESEPPDSMQPQNALAFMHIPKTSGTSLRTALQECLDVHDPAPGFDATAFGGFRDFATVSPELMRDVYIGDMLPDLGAAFVTGHISRATLSARRP